MGLSAGSSLRRVVTHHKGQNSAILSDEELKLTTGFGSNAVTIWRNDKYPAELVNKDPVGSDPVIYTPGSLIRVVDFPPNSSGHNHRTASLDYGIVFEGELEMVLADGSKTIVRAGDIIVQQAVSDVQAFESKYIRENANNANLQDFASVEQFDGQAGSSHLRLVAIRKDREWRQCVGNWCP
ncbi:cupin domain-containing protein [Fusarium mexicanum]|uniref:Cupin domain-containing protein n=1 Tax=Fusarium mexicanum TaxID=751941 RepID=A0A8H5J9J3_9HYPO|nr:cupin domain-containing protein [Fusarium mexicanum]